MRGARHLPVVLAIVLAGLWGAGLGLLHWRGEAPILERIEAPLADLRFLIQGPRAAPDLITIVAVDDEAVQEARAYPLPRAAMARLVEEIAKRGPVAIALDFLFVDPDSEEDDRALAGAMAGAPSIIAAAGVFDRAAQTVSSAEGEPERVPAVRRLLMPLNRFAAVAAVGIVNVATDSSGVPRHVPLLLRADERLLPSFSLRAASVAAGRDPIIEPDRVALGERTIATDMAYALPLRFYGPRGTIRTIGASELLRGGVADDAIRGRIVVVGATVTGGGDVFPTPFDPVLPGVEVLATAIAHLAVGDGLLRDSRVRLADAVVATILPMLLILLLSWHRSALGFGLIAAVALAWVGLTTVVFMQGVWLSATLPLAAAAPPAVIFGAAQLWLDRRRADMLAQEGGTLRRFQPPSLTERLVRDPDFLSTPVRQDAAVIFIDLSGFTGLSEVLGPDETRDILKGFHAVVDESAVRHHGLVASFMGDGAMILFGLPEPSPEDSCRAVEACVDLSLATKAWLLSLPEEISSRLGFKVGAHCGTIVASRLGGGSHEHITAIGDTVNIASRLMEVAAAHGAEIALSDELHRAAGAACAAFDRGVLDGTKEVRIRGRSGTVPVWLWRSAQAT
ncbi:MAG TPA: adenylate/guanylate cyclase domain-containing protein [Microvirga sp.]|nr:adenylate/guanylate cyclase domain-containing protein [Microvirga sp.]